MAHGATRGVTRGPTLAGAGVRGMAIGTQRATVDPRVGNGVHNLVYASAQHRGNNRGGGNTDQNDVIETNPVETILEREHALDLVRLDHGGEYITHRRRVFPSMTAFRAR